LLGFTIQSVELDPHGDFGWLGSVDGLRRSTSAPEGLEPRELLEWHERDDYENALDRSIVARCGVMPTFYESWEGPGAASDRQMVRSFTPIGFSPEGWEFMAEHHALKLVRSDRFGSAHRAVVVALKERGRLSGEEVAEIVAEALENAEAGAGLVLERARADSSDKRAEKPRLRDPRRAVVHIALSAPVPSEQHGQGASPSFTPIGRNAPGA
jgi:hypothetical protein